MSADERAITNQVYALAEAIDDGDLDRVATVFGDATFRLAGAEPRLGGGALARTIERSMLRYEGGRPSTLHQITNLLVQIDEPAGRATADSAVTVYQARPDLPLQAILGGRYHDEFHRRDDGSWAWASRSMTIDLVGDTSKHTANRLG